MLEARGACLTPPSRSSAPAPVRHFAAAPPPPAAMPIQSLPRELLFHVLSLAAGHHSSSGYLRRHRCGTLRVAALVCRTWRGLAQLLLWDAVRLGSSTQISRFVDGTAATGCAVTSLKLVGDDDTEVPNAVAAVEAFSRLKQLKLCTISDLDLQPFSRPQLAGESLLGARATHLPDGLPSGLKHLRVANSMFRVGATTSVFLPFALSHLSFYMSDPRLSRWPA